VESSEPVSPYTVKRLAEMERAFGGAFVRVRAELGITAFGVQIVELPPDSGELSPEHDHRHDGQEELFVLLAGSAELALPDRALALDADTLVRVAPETRRRLRSGSDGARVLVVGATPERAYDPPENSRLGGVEVLDCPTASSAMAPNGPPPLLTT
jgi:mannose-6-phosphate isomerase-like protein (cupin superfamily)